MEVSPNHLVKFLLGEVSLKRCVRRKTSDAALAHRQHAKTIVIGLDFDNHVLVQNFLQRQGDDNVVCGHGVCAPAKA